MPDQSESDTVESDYPSVGGGKRSRRVAIHLLGSLGRVNIIRACICNQQLSLAILDTACLKSLGAIIDTGEQTIQSANIVQCTNKPRNGDRKLVGESG